MTNEEFEKNRARISGLYASIGILFVSNVVLVISLWVTSDLLSKCKILLN